MAYNIRRFEGEKNSRSNLLPVLFNLLDCNLSLRNFVQARQLLRLVSEVVEESEGVGVDFRILLSVKRAKLEFF